MITKQQYVEYLISTIANYTGSYLAKHLDDVSHDVITDYLRTERLTARGLWELVQSLLTNSPEAFLLVDDSVQDKRYSQFIELVKRQYRGAKHGLGRGIGIVNLVCSSSPDGDFWPMDYRIYAPGADGKTKNDHHLDQIDWTPERLQNSVQVKLKEVPFQVQLFKLVATNGGIDWVTANNPAETLTAQVAQDANDVRWHASRKSCIVASNN